MQRLNYSAFNVQKQAKFPRDVEELCQLMQSRCRSCTGRHAGAACSCCAHVTSAGIIPPQVLSILQGAGAAPGLTHAQAPPLCLCHQPWWQQVTGQRRKRPRRPCLCRRQGSGCVPAALQHGFCSSPPRLSSGAELALQSLTQPGLSLVAFGTASPR